MAPCRWVTPKPRISEAHKRKCNLEIGKTDRDCYRFDETVTDVAKLYIQILPFFNRILRGLSGMIRFELGVNRSMKGG